jgi:hypothetical protein
VSKNGLFGKSIIKKSLKNACFDAQGERYRGQFFGRPNRMPIWDNLPLLT